MDIQHNIEGRLCNHSCRGEAIHVTYSDCMSVTLVIQHVKIMCHIILPSLACLALPYFPALCHKQYDFLEKRY